MTSSSNIKTGPASTVLTRRSPTAPSLSNIEVTTPAVRPYVLGERAPFPDFFRWPVLSLQSLSSCSRTPLLPHPSPIHSVLPQTQAAHPPSTLCSGSRQLWANYIFWYGLRCFAGTSCSISRLSTGGTMIRIWKYGNCTSLTSNNQQILTHFQSLVCIAQY